MFLINQNPDSPQRTSASGPCVAVGKGVGQWCRGSCSQTSYHAGEGRWDRYEYRTWMGGKRQTDMGSVSSKYDTGKNEMLAYMFKFSFYGS